MAKYRLNPFTGEFDDSGAIAGLNPVIDFSGDAQELGNFLEDTYKKFYDSTQSTTLYLDQDAGDDDNDGLTALTAVATIGKACQLIHDVYSSTLVTVNVAYSASPYVVPFGFTKLNNVRFLGAQTIAETRNVVANITTSNSRGVEFTIDGAQIADDDWSGRVLYLSGQFSNTRNINVVRNTWNGVNNVIYGAMYNRGFLSDVQSAPGAAGDVNLLTFPTFQFPTTSTIGASLDLYFENLNITGGSIFVNGGSKVQFLRSTLACGQIVAGLAGSAIYILSCNIANTGNTTNGIIASRAKGTLRLGFGNTYVPKNISNAAFMKIKCAEDAVIEWEGGGIFRGMTSNGIFFDSAQSAPISQTALSLVFENQDGSPSNDYAFVINGAGATTGSFYGIPTSNGELGGEYYIYAQLGAQVKSSSSSNVTTANLIASTTNTVSADGGATPSARGPDGTAISGGNPSYSAGYVSMIIIDSSITTAFTADLTVAGLYAIDTTTAAVTATLPSASTYTLGAQIAFKDYASTFDTNNLTVATTGGDTIDNAASPLTVAGENDNVVLVSDGISNWSIY